jgi:outer membrane lipoprotein-sorting protein
MTPAIIRTFRSACVLLLCGIVSVVCADTVIAIADSDEGNATGQADLIKELRELEKNSAETTDLSARFSQNRYSPLLKKPIASSGVYRSVAGLTRWDTAKPNDSVMVVQADRLEIYYPDQKTLEVYPVEKRLGELLATPQPDVDQWQASFKLARALPDTLSETMRETVGINKASDDYLLISLTPREEEVAKLIERLIVVIDKETGLSRAMAWSSEDGGERTEIVFTKIRQNTEIKRADLLLDPPESTRVVYPLGPVGEPEKKPN